VRRPPAWAASCSTSTPPPPRAAPPGTRSTPCATSPPASWCRPPTRARPSSPAAGATSRFKPPTLRGLSARAPYFHNGIAATLRDVVRHDDEVQGFGFTQAEEDDLVAFLEAL
jgi:cytochrome c peroxidase